MFYSEFFVSLIVLIAITTMNILTKGTLFSVHMFKFVLGFLLIIIIVTTIIMYIKELKNKKILEKKMPDIAIDYYKSKYKKDLGFYSLELKNSIDYMFIKCYSGSGYVYIDESKTKYIYIHLNSKFELANINDNIEDDIIIKDIENMLSNTKEKHNAIYSVKLYKRAYVKNQYSYKNNINEYLTSNPNIKFVLTIIKKVEITDEDFNYKDYCDEFSKNTFLSLQKDFNDIEIDMGIIFVKNDDTYNYMLDAINEFDYADILFLLSFDGTDYEELENDKYDCLITYN